MKALGQLRAKAALHIVIDSEIAFDHISEVTHNFVSILVQQALKLGHFLIVVEVLLVLTV